MSIVDLFNIPGDDVQLAFWARMHVIWHRSCNLLIFQKHNVILPEYVLDPIDADDPGVFLQNHQTMHNNIDSVLNIQSYDLQDVDWANQTQRIGWFQAHAQLSQQEANALEISA